MPNVPARDVAKLYARQYGRSISFGTLYTTLRRLSDIGLVTVTRESDDADGRFRYYRLTGTGARSLERTSDELRAKADLTSARLRVNP